MAPILHRRGLRSSGPVMSKLGAMLRRGGICQRNPASSTSPEHDRQQQQEIDCVFGGQDDLLSDPEHVRDIQRRCVGQWTKRTSSCNRVNGDGDGDDYSCSNYNTPPPAEHSGDGTFETSTMTDSWSVDTSSASPSSSTSIDSSTCPEQRRGSPSATTSRIERESDNLARSNSGRSRSVSFNNVVKVRVRISSHDYYRCIKQFTVAVLHSSACVFSSL